MGVVQTAYEDIHGMLALGQIAGTSTSEVDSRVAHEAIPFGRAVSRHSGNSVSLGAVRVDVGELFTGLAADATTINIGTHITDPLGRRSIRSGGFYLIEDEIIYIISRHGDDITMARGQLETTAVFHSELTAITPIQVNVHFAGVAALDERVRATHSAVENGQYSAGEIVAVIYRGDVVVEASEDVSPGDHVVTDADGRLSAEFPGENYILIPGAQWMTERGNNNLAVVRLPGPITGEAGILP